MAKYKMFQVTVPVDEESEDYRRIRAFAEREGLSLEDAVQTIAGWGLSVHMRQNLDLIERRTKKS